MHMYMVHMYMHAGTPYVRVPVCVPYMVCTPPCMHPVVMRVSRRRCPEHVSRDTRLHMAAPCSYNPACPCPWRRAHARAASCWSTVHVHHAASLSTHNLHALCDHVSHTRMYSPPPILYTRAQAAVPPLAPRALILSVMRTCRLHLTISQASCKHTTHAMRAG